MIMSSPALRSVSGQGDLTFLQQVDSGFLGAGAGEADFPVPINITLVASAIPVIPRRSICFGCIYWFWDLTKVELQMLQECKNGGLERGAGSQNAKGVSRIFTT
jgi:hypothetical protein